MHSRTKHRRLEPGSGIFLGVEEIERLNAERRRTSWPRRDYPHIPLTDRSFIHEKLLFSLENARSSLKHGAMSEEQIHCAFADIGPAIEKVVEKEIAKGHIEDFEKENERYFRITDDGEKFLRFSQGIVGIRHGRR